MTETFLNEKTLCFNSDVSVIFLWLIEVKRGKNDHSTIDRSSVFLFLASEK
ncbi:hypothetical protein RV03_GL000714 [Enterococcus gallinarum]|nr:hypothetical protein RV03_GL000714 [Enterococcus gallinarum]